MLNTLYLFELQESNDNLDEVVALAKELQVINTESFCLKK